MDDKDAYVQKLHKRIDEWNAEIDKLKAKADKIKE
jgi:cell division protein FtsB